MKRLSVIVISHNSRPRLEACLAALRGALCPETDELVWVDNGSTDGAADAVKAIFPEAVCLSLGRNTGVAYARNRGLEAAGGRLCLLLDDDTEPNAVALEAMVAYIDSHPSCGVCAVALRAPDGTLQDSYKPYPGLGVKLANVAREKLGLEARPSAKARPCYVIGACQMFRRDDWLQAGPLDEAIFYGPEDADFCLRLAARGLATCYLPSHSIVHHWQRATRRRLLSRLSLLHLKGLLHFWRRHRRVF